MTINGAYCHETGCPNTDKIWNPKEELWESPEIEIGEDFFFDDDEMESE